MSGFRPHLLIAVALAIIAAAWGPCVRAQPAVVIPVSQKFELSDSVQVDQADHAVLVQLGRVKTSVAERQWNDAVEILSRLAETSEGKLLAINDHRFIGLREYCQMQLASLPAEALLLYRSRIDPVARRWYETGVAERDCGLLWNVIDQAFASSYGDKTLMALGEIALESGDYAAARWCWERIVPHELPAGTAWPGYPDSELDLATIRARLVLVSILEGSRARASVDLKQFASLHPDAHGRLAGRDVKYADALASLLAESVAWPSAPLDSDWPTFAGEPRRNKIASSLVDVGAVAWRTPLKNPLSVPQEPSGDGAHRVALCFEPIVVGATLLVNDHHAIQAYRLDRGGPAWGTSATIYEGERAGAVALAATPNAMGGPRFTMTAFAGRLFARMGSAVTCEPQGRSSDGQSNSVVCVDLNAQGRLLWRAESDEGWAFEGSPVADAQGVYVAMRRSDIRPQAFVACLDSETGKIRWRRLICSAETPGHGVFSECTHNLLTLAGNTVYCNTNLGAVAAVRTGDGRLLWVSLYPRERSGDLAKPASHWQRDLNPCVFDHGTLLVAPSDSPRIFSFDAATGQMLWQTGTETADVLHLLGTTEDWLIAGGRRLYWIGLNDADRGRVKHVWPDGPDGVGQGRGLLAGDRVLWPTREALYIFDQKTARPVKVVDLAARGVSGGNLLVAGGRLIMAGANELVVLSTSGGAKQELDEIKSSRISQRF